MFKLPFIKRDDYEKLEKEYAQLKSNSEQEIRNKNYQINNLKEKLQTSEEAIKKVLPKMVNVSIESNYERPIYRICVDIDERQVEHAFIHGDSKEMISYFAEMVGHQVERELNTINFARFRY